MWLIERIRDIVFLSPLFLAIITWMYVRHTSKLAEAASEQLKEYKKNVEINNRPWIFISSINRTAYNKFQIFYDNSGNIPGKTDNLTFEIYHNDILIEDNSSEMHRSATIFPNQNNVNSTLTFDKLIQEKEVIKNYQLEIKLPYYAVNDIKKENKRSYYGVYKIIDQDPVITMINTGAE